MSKRGDDWIKFASEVLKHIEEYANEQYGDKGEDRASGRTAKELFDDSTKYPARFGKVSKERQELDFFKSAHCCCMAWDKWKNANSDGK